MKKVIKILICFLLFFGYSCSSSNNICLGDYFIFNGESNINENHNFLFNKCTYEKLYQILDKDACSIESKKPISSLMRKSDKIIVSCGINDLLPLFVFNDEVIEYSESKINKRLELLDYYVYQTFSLIEEYSKNSEVFIFKQFNPLVSGFTNIDILEKYIYETNQIIEEKAGLFGFKFVELVSIEEYLLDDFVLSSEGYLLIRNSIYGKV